MIDQSEDTLDRTKKLLLITAGTICVGLGIIGLVLPVVPTSPFLLLAAACYARSSKRFYNRLLANPIFGPPIRQWREEKSIPVRAKWLAIAMILITFSITVIFILEDTPARLIMSLIGLLVIVFLCRIPSRG
ncbi:MAG: YbaN family protein [Gammaproteobacteria bacterium]|nr:YbaN family protein [Gammaproteobacteria bacterium]